jgi:hypothetical protein
MPYRIDCIGVVLCLQTKGSMFVVFCLVFSRNSWFVILRVRQEVASIELDSRLIRVDFKGDFGRVI